MLEDELEIQDVEVRELCVGTKKVCYGQRVKVAEGLREINSNLEKRIDILIGLLVISASPTKLDLCLLRSFFVMAIRQDIC